jgi:hypothetical protein
MSSPSILLSSLYATNSKRTWEKSIPSSPGGSSSAKKRLFSKESEQDADADEMVLETLHTFKDDMTSHLDKCLQNADALLRHKDIALLEKQLQEQKMDFELKLIESEQKWKRCLEDTEQVYQRLAKVEKDRRFGKRIEPNEDGKAS